MMLPPSCKVVLVNPTANLTVLRYGGTTDLKYSLILSKLSHVIVMYHIRSGTSSTNYFATQIKINSDVQEETKSDSGWWTYNDNFGLWQGSLGSGTHTIQAVYFNIYIPKNATLDHFQTRALTIVYC